MVEGVLVSFVLFFGLHLESILCRLSCWHNVALHIDGASVHIDFGGDEISLNLGRLFCLCLVHVRGLSFTL